MGRLSAKNVDHAGSEQVCVVLVRSLMTQLRDSGQGRQVCLGRALLELEVFVPV